MALSVYATAIFAIAAVVSVQATVIGYGVPQTRPAKNWTVIFVEKQGYTIETHKVMTVDKFVLTLHRIPGNKQLSNKGGPPVLLHHGFSGSPADWLVQGPGKSLGFILADEGFDVWLANARGTRNSMKNMIYEIYHRPFWNWTFHEIGTTDIPAEIDYILEKTGRKSLSFVGFSLGTTSFFALGATKPEVLSKVNRMVALGPLAHMQHVQSPVLKWLAPLTARQNTMMRFFGDYRGTGEFMGVWDGPAKFMKIARKKFCQDTKKALKMCANVNFLLFGFNLEKANMTLVERISEYSPAGTSRKTFVHFGRLINSAPFFGRYDYGRLGNLDAYGQPQPPAYNVSLVNVPVHIFVSESDLVSNRLDANQLSSELPQVESFTLVTRKGFHHYDFLYAADAAELVYDDVVDMLRW